MGLIRIFLKRKNDNNFSWKKNCIFLLFRGLIRWREQKVVLFELEHDRFVGLDKFSRYCDHWVTFLSQPTGHYVRNVELIVDCLAGKECVRLRAIIFFYYFFLYVLLLSLSTGLPCHSSNTCTFECGSWIETIV